MASSISKWVYRRSAQEVCPWNVSFAEELKEPAFAARDFIARKDARMLAEDLLAIEQADFSAAFRKSPMKRAKLAGLQRNARVVLGRADTRSGTDGASHSRNDRGTTESLTNGVTSQTERS